jgi:hypothetical protein
MGLQQNDEEPFYPENDPPAASLADGLVWDDELPRGPIPWLIEDILPDADDAVLHGETGSLKSFLALRIAFQVATGASLHGKPVRQGSVVYVCGEGAGGIGVRFDALKTQHGRLGERVGVVFYRRAVNLLSETDVAAFIAKLRSLKGVRLIVWDTLNRCMPGADENTSTGYGTALANLARVREATGATNLVLHHPGQREKTRMRGHYSLQAGIQTELLQQRTGDRVTVTVKKQRDGREGDCYGFRSMPVILPVTLPDGSQGVTTTLVLVESRDAGAIRESPTGSAKVMLDALERLGRATHGDWLKACGLPKATFNRLLKDVAGHIEKDADYYTVCGLAGLKMVS